MNLFVADPDWHWWIAFYFFLGGIAAGAYFVAVLIDLIGRPEDRGLARLGYRIAFPLVVVCGLLLIGDLNRPERFWHMLFKSEVVHQALDEGWPGTGQSWRTMGHGLIWKPWSPMSVGSWALAIFGLCSFLSLLGSLWPEGRLARVLRFGWFGRVLQGLGGVVGFFIASYTGALLTATNQPVWSDSTWVAPLFLTSAASTGLATLILLALWRERVAPASLARLERADLMALVLELVVFALFLASLGAFLLPVFRTAHGVLLVTGTLVLGLLTPLALHLRRGASGRRAAVAAAACALVGGFILRYGILTTPPELLARAARVAGTDQPAGTPGPAVPWLSPEDGREPGGGSGADPGNRPAELLPRSKVYHAE